MSQQTMGHARADIKRSESILGKMEGRGLTEAGKEWLIAAFDPFHDRDLDCTGYPDANSSQSMLQVITLSTQISSPDPTNQWDCHIIDWPFLGTTSAKQGWQQVSTNTTPGNGIVSGVFTETSTTGGANSFGGLGILQTLTSLQNVAPFQLPSQFLAQNNLVPAVSDLQNPYRVIGKGFEVYNTTAELYKGGAVCVYKQPVSDYQNCTGVTVVRPTAPATYGNVSAIMMDAPPATVSEALRLPNSRQWDAKEGCYVISPLHHGDIPVHLSNYCQPIYYVDTPGDSTMYMPGIGNFAFAPFGGLAPSTSILNPGDQHFTNFDQCGAIFTGLLPQATLTVNYRLFVEVFPGASSPLSNFSHPSPLADRFALELYSEICHKAPVGVEVKFNGLGDWFIDGINAVKDMVMPIASKVLKSSKHPVANAIGALMGGKKKNDNGLGKINGKSVQGPMTKAQHEKNASKSKKKK